MAQVECPRCKGKIDPRATRCQHCQADFTLPEIDILSEESRRQENNKGIGCLVALGLIVAIAMLGKCGASPEGDAVDQSRNETTSAASELDAAVTDASASEPAAPSPKWAYYRNMDEIRKREIITAVIRSENQVEFDFPYQGGAGLTLTIRKHPQYGQDVAFRIDKGQFNCGIYDCTGMISVDGRSETLSLGPADDHDSEVLFAKYGPAIIKKLKGSKKVIVELPFFQEGNRQFTFETAGLEWPPKE